MVQEWANSV